MANYNRVILCGNLTRDPQLRYLPSQTAVADFGIACNRRFKTASGEDREEVMFIDCAAFGRQAEIINQYCQKGRLILIEGRLKLDTWEDKQGGGKRSKHSVVVENFQLLGNRADAGNAASGGPPDADVSAPPRQGRPAPARPPVTDRAAPPQPAPDQPFPPDAQEFKEDDIPF
ncbi:single-stranded DNA-binding protein [Fontivita pretiosa]|uniref:single-stranded DNA-binding protein n=1 Tax=Fontivita pretiosa TaxID=2989684 RepID=UPI003D174952